MASPFKTFRKNQKAWMVAITILAMISFVFMGNIGGSQRGAGGSQKDPEAFSWKFGTVNTSELRSRIQLQHKVQQFFAQTARAADIPAQQINQQIQNFFPTNDYVVINAMLLNKKAEEMGLVISDDAVKNFIRNWIEQKVGGPEMSNIIRNLGMTQEQLFDAIRFNLAANYAQQTFAPNLQRMNQYMAWFHGDTPAERWDYFVRLNRKASTQILPVAVKDFVDKVAEPTASELQGFYDQYKSAYPVPGSRTPGFREPYKAQIEYVKADNEKLLDEALPTVTEQEIKDYYEKYKDTFFKKSKLPDLPDMGAKPSDDAKSEKPDDASKEKADEKAGAEATKDAKGTGEAKAEPDLKSAPRADTKSEAKSAAPKAGEKSSGAKGSKSTKGADGKQSSAKPGSGLNGELLALADDEIYLAQKADAKGSKAAKSEAKAPKADAKIDAKSDAAKADPKVDTVKDDAKAADAKAADAKAADAKAESKVDERPAAAAPMPEAHYREVEYEPLDKVEGKIKNSVAQQKVDVKVATAFSAIEKQMNRYHDTLDAQHAAELAGKPTGKQIQPPDLGALAKDNGLQYRKTSLTSRQEAYDNLDIGKSRRPVAAGMRTMPPPFVDVAFGTNQDGKDAAKLFAFEESEDNSLNRYLWWQVADQAARTPPLDAIKAEVVQAWKQVQARALASKKADEYAAQVNKSKQTLTEAFGTASGMEVVTPGPFSWLSRPPESPYSQPRRSEVTGLDHVGNEFMKDVFALKTGETGVAPNDPLTVYYVVQIEGEEPPVDTLRKDFLAAMNDPLNSMTYAVIGAVEHYGDALNWFGELKDHYGFKMSPDYKPVDARDYD